MMMILFSGKKRDSFGLVRGLASTEEVQCSTTDCRKQKDIPAAAEAARDRIIGAPFQAIKLPLNLIAAT